MSADIKTLRMQLIELFALLEYKPKQIDERIIYALGDKREIGQMNVAEINKVMEVTMKYVTPLEYAGLLERLVRGAEKIEKLNSESGEFRSAIKLYNRLERLIRELRGMGSDVAS
ncbi:hypothetical protein [Effusibacillus consociatus]|uniref:Uncharacterized protein n=1 Tax=Effusibacillus consociatus TaxID=1117041 RepID=A0ABV9Q2K7_9BACL